MGDVSRVPKPAYAFIPGHWPHPRRDPKGHSYGEPEPRAEPLDLDDWQRCEAYLIGIELFNTGYYWEAHEWWEAAWHASGRAGLAASLLQGLIKLAGAGIKIRQGTARAAKSLLDGCRADLREASQSGRRVAGLDIATWLLWCDEDRCLADSVDADPTLPVQIVFRHRLAPDAP